MSKTQKLLILLFLSLGQGSVYFLPYIRNVYYTPLLETLAVSNADFGSLVSYFAIGCMLLYIPGGIMSDKWNYKKNIVYSLFATALLVGSFGFFMNFSYAKAVFFLLALSTTFVFWSSALKAVRILGGDEQEKTYGYYYAMQGILSIVIQSAMLFVYNQFADTVTGLRIVLFINAAMNAVSAIFCQIYLPNPDDEAMKQGDDGGFEFSMVGKVILNPLIWIISILIFCAYGLYSNSYYFSTYLSEVKGMSFNVAANLSLIRVTYMLSFASLIGGLIASKLRSTTIWYMICAVCSALSCFTFITLAKADISLTLLGAISILPSAFMLLVYGLTSSLYQEFDIPTAYTGTAIGVVSIIGYTPDLLFGPILGSFLDTANASGNSAEGYIQIFKFFGLLGGIGFAAALLALFLKKKQVKAVNV